MGKVYQRQKCYSIESQVFVPMLTQTNASKNLQDLCQVAVAPVLTQNTQQRCSALLLCLDKLNAYGISFGRVFSRIFGHTAQRLYIKVD
jgi:hypothetical protein